MAQPDVAALASALELALEGSVIPGVYPRVSVQDKSELEARLSSAVNQAYREGGHRLAAVAEALRKQGSGSLNLVVDSIVEKVAHKLMDAAVATADGAPVAEPAQQVGKAVDEGTNTDEGGVSSDDESGRRATAAKYIDPAVLFEAVEAGDVALLSARWLLQRAGYAEEEAEVRTPQDVCRFDGSTTKVKKWLKRRAAQPVPCRQLVEKEHPDAFLTAAQLRHIHGQFKRKSRHGNAIKGFDAAPVVSASHCWETPDAPDPEGLTLEAIAKELAGTWGGDGSPTSGLPLYALWGFEDVGVFFDFGSLYQNKLTPRTPEQSESFQRALANMSMWYCHRLTTVYIVRGQDDRLFKKDAATGALVPNPRDGRGWPRYEEAMSNLLASAVPTQTFDLGGPFYSVKAWRHVIEVSAAEEADTAGAEALLLRPFFIAPSSSPLHRTKSSGSSGRRRRRPALRRCWRRCPSPTARTGRWSPRCIRGLSRTAVAASRR